VQGQEAVKGPEGGQNRENWTNRLDEQESGEWYERTDL
jgi:hypothetical protein